MCGSIPPGMTIWSEASTTRVAPIVARLPGAPIATILPPDTPRSTLSAPPGSTWVPPLTTISNISVSPPAYCRPGCLPQPEGDHHQAASAQGLWPSPGGARLVPVPRMLFREAPCGRAIATAMQYCVQLPEACASAFLCLFSTTERQEAGIG